jgi:hypothetical protein
MIKDRRSYSHFQPTGTVSMPQSNPAYTALGRSRIRGTWILLALCLAGPAVPADEATAGREAMAEAMSRMMSAMGLVGQSAAAAANPAGKVPPAGAGAPWEQASEAGRQLLQEAGRAVPAGGLDGLWEASGGGLLIVEGEHFRLYAPYGGYVDGDFQVNGQRIQMASRRAGFALDLEYALDQGRLAMRDARGQVYLYRRLVLTGGD